MPNGSLETLTSCPSAPFPFYSGLAGVAASVINGLIYVTGGDGTGPGITNGETYTFNSSTNTWTTLATRPGSEAIGLSEVVLNGYIYTLDSNGVLEIYNLAANTWSAGAGSGLYANPNGPVLSSVNNSMYGIGVNAQFVSTTEQYWPPVTLYVYTSN